MDMQTTIVRVKPLGFPWETIDPFLFCVYHHDAYPHGNAHLGPDRLGGRELGNDFSGKDGWNMYHGDVVPGFPAHPHRGFETVTIARRGVVDHADSLGASARYGLGDVQWLTTGSGIVHSEMLPLLNSTGPNPLELFQIWLNLPASSKFASPHFKIFWAEDVPRLHLLDDQGLATDLSFIAGRLVPIDGDMRLAAPVAPPPDSWAARPQADVAIWTMKMQARATWTLPAALGHCTRRQLFYFKGESARIGSDDIAAGNSIELHARVEAKISNGAEESEFLLLQGLPIGEPVVQSGPFVMNSQAEISRTLSDYQRTRFGGWPWPNAAPVHAANQPRFIRYADGRVERPTRDR
jgi:redox-sensitive bicupin YhaK (pirin superfamily)